MLRADEPSDDAIEYLGCFHLGFHRLLTVRCVPIKQAAATLYVQTSYSNWLDAPAPRNTTPVHKQGRSIRKVLLEALIGQLRNLLKLVQAHLRERPAYCSRGPQAFADT